MYKLVSALILTLFVAAAQANVQLKKSPVYLENTPIRALARQQNAIIHRPETQTTESIRSKHVTAIQPLLRDETFRVTLNEPPARHAKVENILSFLDSVAYAISKPVAVINVIKFVALALGSFVMSTIILPLSNLDMSKRRNRDRNIWQSLLSPFEIEGVIESIARNYDELLDRSGLPERSTCRERSLCVLGDMMACDFPSFVVTVGRFAQQHLPPIDANRNKYTKAFILGLNQTDCDRAYSTNNYECPTFKDYIKSYFHGGNRRRRDHHYHWRH